MRLFVYASLYLYLYLSVSVNLYLFLYICLSGSAYLSIRLSVDPPVSQCDRGVTHHHEAPLDGEGGAVEVEEAVDLGPGDHVLGVEGVVLAVAGRQVGQDSAAVGEEEKGEEELVHLPGY